MRLHGQPISKPNVEICPIPRGEGNDIIFKCQAVLDMDEFDQLCPTPKIPLKVIKGNKKVEDPDSPSYKTLLNEYNANRINYIILKSLEATESLEWDSIKMGDPSTWANYEKEFKASGFSNIEVMRIVNTVMSANCLNEDRIEKARADFLASQEVQESPI